MLHNRNCLTIGETALQLLGNDTGSSEPSDKLSTSLTALIGARLISKDGIGDIAIPPGNKRSAVDARQQIDAIGDAGTRSFLRRSGLS